MTRPLVCLCLTASTLEEDAAIVSRYRQYIDVAELRVDFLEDDERLKIREFPSMVNMPVILTIRRIVDGGKFAEGEASRTQLFARGLAFANKDDSSKNFAYVDFEEDFHIPSLQDAAIAFGTKIIRSFHDMNNPVTNLAERISKMRTTSQEIPKIACMPHSLQDVTNFFEEASRLKDSNQILCAMGPMGLSTRVLSSKLNSYLTYTSPQELSANLMALGHTDPITINRMFHFHNISDKTKVFGITGWPLKYTSSPKLHNEGYEKTNQDAVYLPFPSENVEDVFGFAKELNIGGFSVTVPHKEKILMGLRKIDPKVEAIGACNTVVRENDYWVGYNTDAEGFQKAVLEFVGKKNLKGKKVAIIGAGGASKAIAYVVKSLGGKGCIFNRTVSKAKSLADKFGMKYAPLGPEGTAVLEKYSDLIIQTTSKGMGSDKTPNQDNDPIYFYNFTGKEMVYDIVYEPNVTPVMQRALDAGCKVENGYSMLKYQGYAQFKLFTGLDYPEE